MKKPAIAQSLRTQTGALSSCLLLAVLFACIVCSVISIDLAHTVAVRHELQNACDAAAIAGAQDLSNDPDNCERHALDVARMNMADGWAVCNTSTPVAVNVNVERPSPGVAGKVRVTATMNVKHMIGPLVGVCDSTLNVTALASGTGNMVSTSGMNLFPLAVSLDSARRELNSRPLNQAHVGESFDLYINSQQYKNAAFTSFNVPNTNSNWIKDAIDNSLNIQGADKLNPPIGNVQIGDDISTTNGVIGSKTLASDPYLKALTDKKVIYIAVVEGEVPFSQQRPLVGFIGLKVNNVEINQHHGVVEKISVQIVKPVTTGMDGIIPKTSSLQNDSAVNEMSPFVAKLID
jgi:Flp pilus assembly protein TadG